jgi:hypothetical protein
MVSWMMKDDEVLFSYSSHPAVLPYVKCFIGKDIEAIHTMLIKYVQIKIDFATVFLTLIIY